jgi:glucose-6-phosphate 1-dehydrogenase
VPDPSTFVLFGATGDLAHRKVIPALYHLWRTHLLPHEFMIVALGRRDYTDEMFREGLRESLANYSRVLPIELDVCDELCQRVVYHRCDFADPAGYASLVELLDRLDEERGTRANRLFYLATQPSAFAEIIAQLGRVGLDHERHEGGWRRVVIEKPFGRDLDSAVRLNREVGKVFRERQVYRIDHYLGKETVRNLLVFRFGNGIFEPIWNRRYIDHVQITVAESIGIEGRGAFYEETGASRDFLQNHLLQLLSLVAMEPPTTFEADALRDEKVKVIRAITELSPDQVRRDVVRGQYGPGWVTAQPVAGYRAEPDVDPLSETETFVAARLTVDDWRWSGVPFYLRMGKRLPKRATEIAIQFKDVPHRLFRDSATDPEPNLLAMRIQPDEGIMLRFGAKVPGLGIDVRNVTMDFTYGSAFQTDSPDAYETLILDALLGDASLFTRADEVEEAWSIVDPIIDAWAAMPPPDFPNYEAGTWGPETADDLIGREGRRWRRI